MLLDRLCSGLGKMSVILSCPLSAQEAIERLLSEADSGATVRSSTSRAFGARSRIATVDGSGPLYGAPV